MRVKSLAHKSVRLECRLLKGPAHTLYMQPLREPLFQRSARGDTGLWQENEYPTVFVSLRSSLYIHASTIVSRSSPLWITSVKSGKSSLFLKPNKKLSLFTHGGERRKQRKTMHGWKDRRFHFPYWQGISWYITAKWNRAVSVLIRTIQLLVTAVGGSRCGQRSRHWAQKGSACCH